MKHDKVHVKIVPDIRRIKTASKYPLKLRITHKGVRKYYATGLDVSDQQWEIINSPEVKGKYQKMRIEMAEIEKKALECVDRIVPFSFAVLSENSFARHLVSKLWRWPMIIISRSYARMTSLGRPILIGIVRVR